MVSYTIVQLQPWLASSQGRELPYQKILPMNTANMRQGKWLDSETSNQATKYPQFTATANLSLD